LFLQFRVVLLCTFFRKASFTVTERQDLQQFVGDAAGSIPVFFFIYA